MWSRHGAPHTRPVLCRWGDAELVALVRAATKGMAVASLPRDMGDAGEAQVRADSSTAIAICKRTGVGKVQHLGTRLLWWV